MSNIPLIYIKEPLLVFGHDQKVIDPRDGITLFGPYSKKHISSVNIGVIGTTFGRSKLIEWLKRIQKPVYSKDMDIARPFFPGMEAAFEFGFNTSSIQEIDIPEQEINKFLHYSDSHQRVYNLVRLFADNLEKFEREEEVPVTVWFVVIPDQIYIYGRPQSRIPNSDENVRIGLSKRERKSKVGFLFSEDRELSSAYQYQVNFHNQLKARLLERGIITQIVRERTIAYRELLPNKRLIDKEELFDSAKAWSVSTALYYKSGGLPWKLGSVREGVCYIGLVYKRVEANTDQKTACCAAQMFLDSGDGMVFKGNIGPWYNPNKDEYHMSRESAKELIEKAINGFRDKNNVIPKEIFIHAKTFFDQDEWDGFNDAIGSNTKVVGVRIRGDDVFKLYRDYTYPVPRGMSLVLNERNAYLWTKGFVPRLQTAMGLETPNPLKIEIVRGDSDIIQVCKDILSLTKLNYNACVYGDGLPVTLRFANSIGEILTAGPGQDFGVLTFKHYI